MQVDRRTLSQFIFTRQEENERNIPEKIRRDESSRLNVKKCAGSVVLVEGRVASIEQSKKGPKDDYEVWMTTCFSSTKGELLVDDLVDWFDDGSEPDGTNIP